MAELNGDSLTQVVSGIWQRVLNVDEVTLDDDFFELGGHSLNAMRIIAMLRRDVASDITVDVLFDHPEFAEFVRWIGDHLAAGPHDAPVNAEPS